MVGQPSGEAPIVRNFRDDTHQHEITRVQLGRALLVLHALITTAEAHGMTVGGASARPNERGWSSWAGTSNGHLTITFDECAVTLRLTEVGLPSRTWWFAQHSKYNVDKGAYPLHELKPFLGRWDPYGQMTGRLR